MLKNHLLSIILKKLLEISSDLKLFSNLIEKMDTQIGNLREDNLVANEHMSEK